MEETFYQAKRGFKAAGWESLACQGLQRSLGLDYGGRTRGGAEAPPGAKGSLQWPWVRPGSSSLGSGPSAAASPSQEAVETLCAGPSRSVWQWGEGLGGEVWGEGLGVSLGFRAGCATLAGQALYSLGLSFPM